METPSDPRIAALVALAPEGLRPLVAGLMQGFDLLEQIDLGELEPVGIASPTGER